MHFYFFLNLNSRDEFLSVILNLKGLSYFPVPPITTNDVMKGLVYTREETGFGAPSGITAFVKGYTQGITSGKAITGDVYSMDNSEGAIRYLTFDPPPDGYLDPKTLEPI